VWIKFHNFTSAVTFFKKNSTNKNGTLKNFKTRKLNLDVPDPVAYVEY